MLLYNTAQLAPYLGAATRAAQQADKEASSHTAKRSPHIASPYQKAAAVRSAEGAVRPWSAITGLGERQGQQFATVMAELAAAPDGPTLHFPPPDARYATTVAAAAGRVARPGMGQMGTPGAWSPVPGARARELWPQDLSNPPPTCSGCRGLHDPSHEAGSGWDPTWYTPRIRLVNLHALASRFQTALLRGELCVALNGASRVQPVKWTWREQHATGAKTEVTPTRMPKAAFVEQLGMMCDGLREGHEPFRHLATQAVYAFLSTGSSFLVDAVPVVSVALRTALQTYEPHLVGHALLILQRLVRSHRGVGPALAPHLRQLLPPVALMRKKRFTVHLPPPFCVSPTGSFTGSGIAPEAGGRTCGVCGCPVDKESDSQRARDAAVMGMADNPHLLGSSLPPEVHRHALHGRWSKKYKLQDVISDTLEVLVKAGGPDALTAVQSIVPCFCYHNPPLHA